MHPILAHRQRLAAYLVPWLLVGALLALLLVQVGNGNWLQAWSLGLPLALVYAFICLAAWYPSKSNPLSSAHWWRAVPNHFAAALASAVLWRLLGQLWAGFLDRFPNLFGVLELYQRQAALFFVVGLLLYSLAAAACYVFLAIEASWVAQRQTLEAQRLQLLSDQELDLARGLQRRLLPAPELEGNEFRLAAHNLAARGVAGDFYDYFSIDNRIWLAVADVAGKGMAASLIMATVKAMLPLIAQDRSPVDTMRYLNDRLAQDLAAREFVALSLATFEPSTGRLELVNAGLPDPYWLGSDGVSLVEAPFPRLPLGIRRGLEYQSIELTLERGDKLLMLTDGLPEAPKEHDEPLGYEKLQELIEQQPNGAPGPWIEKLCDQVRALTTEQNDDWTALLLERQGDAAQEAS